MKRALAGLLTVFSVALALSAPAEAGWKWKKMKYVPKPGQEFRSPYAHPGYGYGRGYANGYGRGYGYDRGYGSRGYYDQPYATDHRFGSGYARPTGPFGGSAFPPRGWD